MARSSSRDAELDPGFAGGLLGYLVTLAELSTRRTFQRCVGEPFELRPVEFTLLALLQANGSASAKQIGSALRLPAPHVTTLVDRLAERRLVERGRDPADGRAVRIVLTDAGAALAERLRAVAATMEDDLLDTLDPAEQAQLRRLLRKLAQAG